jgi:hypothetical protein
MANILPGSNGFYSAQAPGATSPTNGYYAKLQNGSNVSGAGASAGAGFGVSPPVSAGNGTFGTMGATGVPTPNPAGGSSVAGFQKTPGQLPTSTPTSAPSSGAGVLSTPGYGETEFAQHGNDLTGKSNSQSLYDEGVSATNPYYQNAVTQANKGIDLAESARGEGNSGAALAEIGTADANLYGQQALAQQQLAGQADSANTGQYTATMNAAEGAQNATTNRVNSATSAYTNLSNDQANMVDKFYSMAESGQLTGDMASIEAQLAASGVDAATANAIANDLIQVGGIAAKAATGGK